MEGRQYHDNYSMIVK